MPTNWFDEDVAATYDDGLAPLPEAGLAVLERLAGPGGRAIEFAIGTGRVALPLAGRGLEVAGIDVSEPMLARLRAKPGAGAVRAGIGDFTATRVPGEFRLVYLVWNTIQNVTTQDEQVATFRNAAAHLAPGGRFLVEVNVPALQRLPPGETVRAFALTPEHLGFDEYDVATQRTWSHHYRLVAGEARLFSVAFRYVWPAELDLMAQLAGMELRERWADWDRTPFGPASASHVSVYVRP